MTATYGSISTAEPPAILVYDDRNDESRPATARTWRFLGVTSLIVAALVLVSSWSSHGESASMTASFFPDGHMPSTKRDEDSDDHHHHHHHHSLPEHNVPHYYSHQLVDHFDLSHKFKKLTYKQKYYQSKKYIKGKKGGFPIFIIVGGEGPITDADGILYPFVYEHLAKRFGGLAIQTEHRFYGESMPVSHKHDLVTPDEMKLLLTPHQAMADTIQIIRHKQHQLGCETKDKNSKHYCPVVTIGGSYPGFLASMLRINHPDVVDAAYASSAVMRLYSQSTPSTAYYEKITKTAELSSPGCAAAVKRELLAVADTDAPFHEVAKKLNICVDNIPDYINSNKIFFEELNMVVANEFADANMGYYPPGETTDLFRDCQAFQNDEWTTHEKIAVFLSHIGDEGSGVASLAESDELVSAPCFDLNSQIPPGPNGTISGADWSGVGGGDAGYSWDFQTCDPLVVAAGFSEDSMFPLRPWTLEWLTKHCESRFQVKPEPLQLVKEWGIDDIVGKRHASRILFTNGLNDGWSVASILEDSYYPPENNIRVVNIPNGAHHSDLSHEGPNSGDTPDMTQAFEDIKEILGEFLDMVGNEDSPSSSTD